MSGVTIPEVLDRGVFGWDGARLSEHYTSGELSTAISSISSDPNNKNPDHASGNSIYLLKKSARARIYALTWAIFYLKQEGSRAAQAGGTP